MHPVDSVCILSFSYVFMGCKIGEYSKGRARQAALSPKVIEIALENVSAIAECTGSGEHSEAALLRARFADASDILGACFPHINDPAYVFSLLLLC